MTPFTRRQAWRLREIPMLTSSPCVVGWRPRERVGVATAKFRVAQHLRISKEKMKFAKAAELNFSTEIFRIVKVIDRRPRAVYELEELNGTIDGQFYQEGPIPLRITSRTT